jgi:hypothetical protein
MGLAHPPKTLIYLILFLEKRLKRTFFTNFVFQIKSILSVHLVIKEMVVKYTQPSTVMLVVQCLKCI